MGVIIKQSGPPFAQAPLPLSSSAFSSVAGDQCCSADCHLSWLCQDGGERELWNPRQVLKNAAGPHWRSGCNRAGMSSMHSRLWARAEQPPGLCSSSTPFPGRLSQPPPACWCWGRLWSVQARVWILASVYGPWDLGQGAPHLGTSVFPAMKWLLHQCGTRHRGQVISV